MCAEIEVRERMEVMEVSALSINSQRSSQQQALMDFKYSKPSPVVIVVVTLRAREFCVDSKGLKVCFPLISTTDSQ